MKKKKQMIGCKITIPEHVKEEYISRKVKASVFVIVEIYPDKKYGAVAKLFQRNSIFRVFETTTKEEREKMSKRIKNIKYDNKPVDTSKWVKHNEESIRNALIENLFMLEILKEDSPAYGGHLGKAKVLYAILHDHYPKNPQPMMSWGIDPYFEKIMDELKCEESKKYWKEFNACFKKDKLGKTKKIDWDKRREQHQKWKERILKKMIVKDPKPHKFKDIFKDIKVPLKNEKEKTN